MSTATRVLLILGGIVGVLTAVYMFRTSADLPDQIPMGYDGDGDVTWYAARDGFWMFVLLPWLGLSALFLSFARRAVSVAWAFLWINAFAFFVYDLTYNQATGDGIIGVSPGGFIAIMFAFATVLIVLAVRDASRYGAARY